MRTRTRLISLITIAICATALLMGSRFIFSCFAAEKAPDKAPHFTPAQRKTVSVHTTAPWREPVPAELKAHIEQNAREAFDNGEQMYIAGHYDQAFRQWQFIVKKYPHTQGEAVAHRCMAQYWRNIKHQMNLAITEYNKAIALDPDGQVGRDAMFGKAYTLYAMGNYSASFRLLSILQSMHIDGELGGNISHWYDLAWAHYTEQAKWQARGIKIAATADNNCGPIALSIVCNRLGIKTNRTQVQKLSRMSPDGATLLDLKNAASRLGVNAHGYLMNPAALKQLNRPCVAWVEGNHFVAVIGANEKGVNYIDGDFGHVHLDWDQFKLIWKGAVLVVDKPGTDPLVAER